MKKTKLRPVSKKRQAESQQYRKSKERFLKQHPRCPVMFWLDGGRRQTTQIHHAKGRDGKLYLDERFWFAVSAKGHKWIHENPKEAQVAGFLFLRGYGLHDAVEARVCERRRRMDFYEDREYAELLDALKIP